MIDVSQGVVIGRGGMHADGHDGFGHRSFTVLLAVRVTSRADPTESVVLIDERAVQYLGPKLTNTVDPSSPECSICLENHCTDAVRLSCKHTFCYACIQGYVDY